MSDLLRSNLGLTLRELRRAPAFAGLPPLPWQVFIAIALHWQAREEAWPSQDTLGRLSGYAVRTVRRGVAELGDEDLPIARVALGEHFQRRYPDRPAPRLFDERDVHSVARCAAATTGDRETKLRTLRDAIDGAFRTSARAPTVRFVWDKLEHFFEHAERGRRARAQVAASVRPPPAPDVPIPAAQIEADLVKLFGPSWRTRR